MDGPSWMPVGFFVGCPFHDTRYRRRLATQTDATQWRDMASKVRLYQPAAPFHSLSFTLSLYLSFSLVLSSSIDAFMQCINVIIATGCFCEADDKDDDDNGLCIGACRSRCPSNAVALGR